MLPPTEVPSPHHHYRGFGGEVAVTDVWDPAGMSLGFVHACQEVDKSAHGDHVAGIDYNGRAQLGAGLAQTTVAGGRRSYPGPAFLCPAFTRRNVTVRPRHPFVVSPLSLCSRAPLFCIACTRVRALGCGR